MPKRAPNLRFQTTQKAVTSTPVGKRQRLKIERLAHDGRGIGFLGKDTWFVDGALPDEDVEVRVLSARSRVVEARAERWFSESPLRQPEPCRHAKTCGGCNLQALSPEEQLRFKQSVLADALQRQAGITPQAWAEPLSGPSEGYRRRVRVSVKHDDKTGKTTLGFRAVRSQQIVPIDDCLVLMPSLRAIFRELPTLLTTLQRPQHIGHFELFSGSSDVLLVRHTAPLSAEDMHALRNFSQTYTCQLWLQGKGEPQPDQLGQLVYSELPEWQLQLPYQPGGFTQVNSYINARMIRQALDWLAAPVGAKVLDLFCGMGNFSLPLAKEGAQVLGIEGAQAMVTAAQAHAEQYPQCVVRFQQADLFQPLENSTNMTFTHVLLDPPRDGAWQVCQQMSALGAQRVVYVSCNPVTLARDAAALLQQGFVLEKAGVMDMFPHTAHVEAMALFVRKSAGKPTKGCELTGN